MLTRIRQKITWLLVKIEIYLGQKGVSHMAYTSFGEFVRILRIKRHEVMGDMAKVLNVKVPFLSAVENGKKNVPSEWAEKIAMAYSLNDSEKDELYQAIEESRTQYKIPAINAGIAQRRAALYNLHDPLMKWMMRQQPIF